MTGAVYLIRFDRCCLFVFPKSVSVVPSSPSPNVCQLTVISDCHLLLNADSRFIHSRGDVLIFKSVISVPIHQISQEQSLSATFVNLEATQLLIGKTVWFCQSEVVLLSNATRYRKVYRTF